MEAAREATREIGLAVLATTLSLVVIFVPVSFMSSIAGRFLYQFGLTAAVAILVSLFVSFTLTPMMAGALLKPGARPRRTRRRRAAASYSLIERAYVAMLRLVAALPPARAAVARSRSPGACRSRCSRRCEGIRAVRRRRGRVQDRRERARGGTSLAAMEQALGERRREIRAVPEVRTTLVTGGGTSSGGEPRQHLRAHRAARGAHVQRGPLWRALLRATRARPSAATTRSPT
jgi:HAE1 family hydrophobic/amphiphilic exporter-1